MSEEKTIFEKIIDGEIPSTKIYEDDHTYAFLDISPNTRGHTLVVPKKPYKDFLELPKTEMSHFFETVQKISKAMKEGIPCGGLNIVINNGSSAGQVVFHLHAHLIPRQVDDIGYFEKKYI
jgi:histidine triad (HIT) family protein